MSRREFAAEVEISYVTLKTSLLPSGRAPGKGNVERLQRWLEAIEARKPGAAENGGAREAIAPAYRLTTAEREKLAARRAHEEERTPAR